MWLVNIALSRKGFEAILDTCMRTEMHMYVFISPIVKVSRRELRIELIYLSEMNKYFIVIMKIIWNFDDLQCH